MRFAALAFALLAACSSLPDEGTPYFETTTSGDNLYPATAVRVYANDQRVLTSQAHPLNNNRGNRSISTVPGAFEAGLKALEELPTEPQTESPQIVTSPDVCCHVSYARSFNYFDGIRVIGITEAVWRRVEGIPPFVDLPIPAN